MSADQPAGETSPRLDADLIQARAEASAAASINSQKSIRNGQDEGQAQQVRAPRRGRGGSPTVGEYVAAIVARAPPLSVVQVEELRDIFAPRT